MSGWGSQSHPPPRRSRSRSPGPRGSQYGGDFGGYSYGGFDDRGGYERRDYRGRSRSPGGYDDMRKRRRSPSPYDRSGGGDRYEPRPRYQEDFDAHTRSRSGHSPTRRYNGPGTGPGGGRGRQYPDPYQMDSPASFKQFAEWFRHTFPRETNEDDIADKIAADANEAKPKGMRVRYDKYKKEFHCRQVQTLFDYHRKAPWFQERYDPTPPFENLRKRVRKEGWAGRLEKFILDLEDGKFDPLPADDTPPSEAPGDELKTAKDEPDIKQEDDQMFDEDGGDDDARTREQPRRSAAGSDEISIPPDGNEVMIRTIAPDIGRVKLEENLKNVPGFLHLALGEPMQKRNYYRAGWIRFDNDADMEKAVAELGERKIDGFKLHVSHTTRPFVTRIKHTPEVASRPDRIRIDLDNVRALASKLEAEAAEIRRWKEPVANPNGAEAAPDGTTRSDDVTMDDAADIPNGSEAVERRAAKLIEDLPKPENEGDEDFETRKLTIALDLYVAYVRAAFNACYYCAAVTDHVEELHRKCAGHHRRPLSQKPPASDVAAGSQPKPEGEEAEKDREQRNDGRPVLDKTDEQFLEKLDARMGLLLRRDKVDPKDFGGKNPDEELSKLIEPHMKQEDESKYRCKTCNKLFKATSFIEKHILNKHGDLVKGHDELTIFNNFALDPQRIQPYTRVPVPTGTTPLAPQAFGLQAPAHPLPDFNGSGIGGRGPNGGFAPQFNGGAYGNGYGGDFPANGGGGGGGFREDRRFDNSYRPAPRSPPRGGGGGDRYFGGGGGARGPAPDMAMRPMAGGGRQRRDSERGAPPPPPPDAKEDPRATAGRKISYHDMDEVAEGGDIELIY